MSAVYYVIGMSAVAAAVATYRVLRRRAIRPVKRGEDAAEATESTAIGRREEA